MGLFDGQDQKQLSSSYNNTVELLRVQQEIQEQKRQAQIQMYNQAVAAKGGNYGASIQGLQAADRNRIDPNKSEAFQIPLSQLVTMWQVRFGDEWLDDDQKLDDTFYRHAKHRLDHNGLFERFDGYLRLKENAETLLANR